MGPQLILPLAVRLVMQGHNHHYERFKPLVDGAQTVQGKGVTYLVTGGGGRSLYSLGAEERRVVGVEEHHFLVGEADECRISIRAISKTGEQLDHFALLRC